VLKKVAVVTQRLMKRVLPVEASAEPQLLLKQPATEASTAAPAADSRSQTDRSGRSNPDETFYLLWCDGYGSGRG
jgi:hypothetical protein